jgi:geranylgeranyl pyrophosphate synthase
MRDTAKVLENMPPTLEQFYADNITYTRTGIADYLPTEMNDDFFTTITGLTPLFDQDYSAIYDSILLPTHQYLASGGKVLRPILCALILEAYGTEPEKYKPLLGAIEVMEDSSLIMDDYIDNSLLRRGADCAHIRHGFPLANIAGCAGFAMSHYVFDDSILDVSKAQLRSLLDGLTFEHLQMAFGQIEELYWTESDINDVSEPQYLQETIARCAFLSFRGPIRYGAIIAGAPESDFPALLKLGEYLLIGYHIKGDDLDMSPDSPAWGKVAGEDITTGRRTLLINHTLSVASEDDKEIIEAILISRTDDEDEKRKVYEMIIKYNTFSYTSQLAKTYYDNCVDCINQLSISEKYKKLLVEFTDFAMVKRKV